MQPVHGGSHPLEEPRSNAGHPWGAIGVAGVSELGVNGTFAGLVAGRMNPGERAEALIHGLGVICILRQSTRQEGHRDLDLVDDIRLPVPRGRTCLKRAQEDVAAGVFGLSRAVSVEVGQVDDHGGSGDARGVHAEEKLEVQGCCSFIHDVEIVLKVRPGRSPAPVVDGESINAGSLGEGHVVGVVEIWGLIRNHVVGKDHGRRGGCATCMVMMMKGCMMRGGGHDSCQCGHHEATERRDH